jgi:Tol biopolymer transport system component
MAVGTVEYMSPEQVRAEELDARTDLFSFGLVLYEMATGRRAFAGDSPGTIFEAILNRAPIPALRINPELPDEFEKIISKALEKDRRLRYQSAAEIRTDLLRLKRDSDSGRAVAAGLPRHIERGGVKPPLRRWLAIALAGVVLIAVAVLAYWLTRPLPPPRVTNAVRIVRMRGGTVISGLCTDGTRIYFTDWLGDSAPLMQVSVAGGEAVPVPTPFRYTFPAGTSPNRSELLVFGGDNAVEQPLWVLPASGGSPRRLGDILPDEVAWSPDGQKLFYAKGSDLFLATGDGTESRKLATVPGVPTGLGYSPDGSVVRFSLVDPKAGTRFLYEVSANGTNLHRLLPGWSTPGEAEYPGDWTPDGKYFVFSAFRNNRRDLWAIREKAGRLRKLHRDPVLLTAGPMSYAMPLPSLDGKKLYAIGRLFRGELVRCEAKTHAFLPYLSGISAWDVDLSRDGQLAAYVPFPGATVWRSKLDGSERLQLTFEPLGAISPRWSPDGKQIVFMGRTPGKPRKIYLVSAGGGTPRQLIPGDREEADPEWSPDGNQLLFGLSPAPTSEPVALHLLDLRTNQVSTIPDSEGLRSPRWSHDGRYIAVLADQDRKLVLFDFKTHRRAELATSLPGLGSQNWSRDGTSIYFWYVPTEGQAGIYRVRLSDRKLDRIVSDKEVGRIWGAPAWVGLAPDDSPLVMRDKSLHEIHAFDWEAP